jgi:hypothetical protein
MTPEQLCMHRANKDTSTFSMDCRAYIRMLYQSVRFVDMLKYTSTFSTGCLTCTRMFYESVKFIDMLEENQFDYNQ